jgi:hypothetical protein
MTPLEICRVGGRAMLVRIANDRHGDHHLDKAEALPLPCPGAALVAIPSRTGASFASAG